MSDGTEGLFFWAGIMLIAAHYHGAAGSGVVLVVAALLMIGFQTYQGGSDE